MKRPYVQIRGIVDEMCGTIGLETVYMEEGEEPLIERMDFMTLKGLNMAMNKCIARAKKLSYDYDVNLIVF